MMRSARYQESMNTFTRFFLIAILISTLISPVAAHPVVRSKASTPPRPAQYDDPYSEFRNVRYSNGGLLNERDELKLGTQLHREVTKKFNLTDVGLARV